MNARKKAAKRRAAPAMQDAHPLRDRPDFEEAAARFEREAGPLFAELMRLAGKFDVTPGHRNQAMSRIIAIVAEFTRTSETYHEALYACGHALVEVAHYGVVTRESKIEGVP